jgi:hypothetical protein
MFSNSCFIQEQQTHAFQSEIRRKGAIFQQKLLLNSVSYGYVPWEKKNMILNLEESVNFFAIWPGIAPYLCNDCAVKVIKYSILNFPSLKGSTFVD